MLGEFDADDTTVVFHGRAIERKADAAAADPGTEPQPPPTVPALGTIVSDQGAGDGIVSADIEFAEVGPAWPICELVLHYEAETRAQLDAGLGAEWAMFAIREWPGSRNAGGGEKSEWQNLMMVGDRRNLKSGRPYHVEASVAASEIVLSVDGVRVAGARVPRPLPPRGQVGLFCLSAAPVTIRNIKIATAAPRAFIVMQFGSPFNEIYTEVIKKACQDKGLVPTRADEIYGPGIIIKDISDQILRSQLVIADVTPLNANVFWEVGYAHALAKPIILLAEKGTKLPFDVSAFRTLFYENSIGGRAAFDEGLRRHLDAILGQPT